MLTGQTMIRAFAVLSFSALAACASSHAAPPAAQPQGQWAVSPAPEDPYAEGEFVPDQACGPNSTCSFECPAGGCSYLCAEGSRCNVECDGGNCRLSCADDATCNLECDGGQCGTACGDRATCNLECDGGSCAHACAPDAECDIECDGGNCT